MQTLLLSDVLRTLSQIPRPNCSYEDDGEISYLVSDGKILIEVHNKKECAIKLKKILDNEW